MAQASHARRVVDICTILCDEGSSAAPRPRSRMTVMGRKSSAKAQVRDGSGSNAQPPEGPRRTTTLLLPIVAALAVVVGGLVYMRNGRDASAATEGAADHSSHAQSANGSASETPR